MSSQNESRAVLIQWSDKPQGGKYFTFYFLFIQACPRAQVPTSKTTSGLLLALEILN
jgi:hypothetical protein